MTRSTKELIFKSGRTHCLDPNVDPYSTYLGRPTELKLLVLVVLDRLSSDTSWIDDTNGRTLM